MKSPDEKKLRYAKKGREIDRQFIEINAPFNTRQGRKYFIETAWVENKLVFDNETFEEVALKMERWYDVTIHICR